MVLRGGKEDEDGVELAELSPVRGFLQSKLADHRNTAPAPYAVVENLVFVKCGTSLLLPLLFFCKTMIINY